MRELNEKEVKLIIQFFQKMKSHKVTFIDAYRWTNKDEERVLKSLINKGILYAGKSRGCYRLTPQAITILNSYGFAEEITDILTDFLRNCKGKMKWKTNELIEYSKENKIDEWELDLSIKFGIQLNFLEVWWNGIGQIFPSIKVTMDGETFCNKPHSFVNYIHIDERNFIEEFDDDLILEFLKEYSKETENFEIEFKQKAHMNDVKRTIAGFANNESGILAIGFDNEGEVYEIDDIDLQKQTIAQAVTEISGIKANEVKTRVVSDKKYKKGILVFVPKTQEILFIGETVVKRIDNINIDLNKKQVVDLVIYKQETQCGHLWLKSLRYYKSKQEAE